MSSSFRVTVPPTLDKEPVTIGEVKQWLRIDWPDDDNLIQTLISRARAYAEGVTHRALAVQTIQQIDSIERPTGGELSGPINRGPNWYQYQEEIGANPFGAAQFYFDLAMPPVIASAGVTMEYKTVAFDTWHTFQQVTNPDGSTNTWIDDDREPARLYVQDPVTVNFWRFTYQAGYDNATYFIPPDLKQCITEAACYWYDHRQAEDLPEALLNKLLLRRVDWF